MDVWELAGLAVERMLAAIKATLDRYGVHFDVFFSERTLHEGSPSQLERALALLQERGHLYRSEGALWMRTTTFGDDKDRVVVRTAGEPTYLAADVAYMLNKRERGFERQLLPLGADHKTYAVSLKAVMAALGGDPDTVESPILQFVHLVEGGQAFAMSKRRGDFITLDDLLDEIGVDATRFFMLQRSNDRTIDLDVGLARKQSRENPVYYVQYAHARIASMLDKAGGERVAAAIDAVLQAPVGGEAVPLHASERALIEQLLAFPAELAEAADRRAPHRVAAYALALAQTFTAFYRDCQVVGLEPQAVGGHDGGDAPVSGEAVESLRIALCVASARVIARSLGLLGVSAPERM
jgi:arginyl-tRNA synthetase